MKKYIISLFLVILVASCTEKKAGNTQTTDENNTEVTPDSTRLTQSFDSLIVAEARAAVDSEYAQSDAYKSAHEAYEQMITKMTDGLNEADIALFELQLAAKSLQVNGRHFASNTDEMRDPVNQQRMRITAQKAMELGRKVQTMGLTPEQQTEFDSLKTIIHLK